MKLSPTENMTVLVTSEHSHTDYATIAAALLAESHVQAEQVGFVRPASSDRAQVRLHMAGDEFCGNACMALAALTAAKKGLPPGQQTEIVVETSGLPDCLPCHVEQVGGEFACWLEMPAPLSVEPAHFPGAQDDECALVRYPDAAHLIVECSRPGDDLRSRAENAAARLGASEDLSVITVLLYDRAHAELTPLVFVPAVGSLIWERSCGSGTASLGAYLATRQHATVCTEVSQPGGHMRVRAVHGPRGLTGLHVWGRVRIIAEGKAYIHD